MPEPIKNTAAPKHLPRGVLPYGATPAERAAVGLVRRLRADGLTYRHVAARLNFLVANGGLARARGAKWHVTSVRRICEREGIARGYRPKDATGAP